MASKSVVSQEQMIQVLSEWKKQYTKALIQALKPEGDVLQIGFGTGDAAECIRHHHPATHTILESDPQRFAAASQWAKQHPNTTALEGGWEAALARLGTFHCIFFNEDAVDHDIVILNSLFPEEGQRLASEAKRLFTQLEEEFSHVTQHFSDEEIEDFYQKTGKANLNAMYTFFQTLRSNGNISQAQFAKFLKKYKLDKIHEEAASAQPAPANTLKTQDALLLCLEACFKGHVKPSGRFSAFLAAQTSKYEDSQFFDRIITHAEISYTEETVPIKMSDKTRNALIFIAENST